MLETYYTLLDELDRLWDAIGGIVGLMFFLLTGVVLWAMFFPSPTYKMQAQQQQQHDTRHREQMDYYVLRGMTPDEAERAIQRNDAKIQYWLDR